jgi:hypothetical protein
MGRAHAGRLRLLASAFTTRGPAWRDASASPIASALQGGERVEAIAHCSIGLREAGVVALTDRRILFAPREGAVRAIPYSEVRAVHEQGGVATRRRVRLAVTGSPPFHLVAALRDDLCRIVRRHTAGLG